MDSDTGALSTPSDADSVGSELENLRTITSLMSAAVARCSRDLRYVWVSPEYAGWIGRDADAIVGRAIVDIVGTEAFETIRPYVERVLSGERADFEFEADFTGMGTRWVHAVYVPAVDATGTTTGWVARVDDITDRIELEQAQTRLAAIVEGSDDAIIGKTLNGIVMTWNSGAERLFEYTAAEMIGQPIHRLVPADRPDDVDRILSAVRRGHRVDHYETQRIRKDGRRISVSLTVSPIRNRAGHIIGASKIARDVTERRVTDADLRESLDILTALNRASAALSAELDLRKVVQTVTDIATDLVGAQFGAFFYNAVDGRGESYMLCTLSGAPREAFTGFPMPRKTLLFGATFRGERIVRIDDVRTDERYGKSAPYYGLPPGHLPVVSYLAVPVTLRRPIGHLAHRRRAAANAARHGGPRRGDSRRARRRTAGCRGGGPGAGRHRAGGGVGHRRPHSPAAGRGDCAGERDQVLPARGPNRDAARSCRRFCCNRGDGYRARHRPRVPAARFRAVPAS